MMKKNKALYFKLLQKRFTDLKDSLAYSSPTRLLQGTSTAKNRALHRQWIQEWLRKQRTLQLHTPLRKHFRRNRVFVPGMFYQLEADLLYMQNLRKHNAPFSYLLCVIDVFSKVAWATPLRDKEPKSVAAAFQSILDGAPVFKNRPTEYFALRTDAGSEFIGQPFQKMLNERGIHHFIARNETKASVVERFQRSLRQMMGKYFTEQNTFRYIDVLDRLLEVYNRRYHRSIKMRPIDVTLENQSNVFRNLYPHMPEEQQHQRNVLPIGSFVRISKLRGPFAKGSQQQNFSEEVFKIVAANVRDQEVTYTLEDLLKRVIKGNFYRKELVPTELPKEYHVEKILHKRGNRAFVKFVGWPSAFNQYVPLKNLRKL